MTSLLHQESRSFNQGSNYCALIWLCCVLLRPELFLPETPPGLAHSSTASALFSFRTPATLVSLLSLDHMDAPALSLCGGCSTSLTLFPRWPGTNSFTSSEPFHTGRPVVGPTLIILLGSSVPSSPALCLLSSRALFECTHYDICSLHYICCLIIMYLLSIIFYIYSLLPLPSPTTMQVPWH
jgi:hypothetical protein